MLLRCRFCARRELEEKDGHPIAAAFEMDEGRLAAIAESRPGRGLGREQIDAEILMDRHAFAARPIEIRIDDAIGRGHERALTGPASAAMREATPVRASSSRHSAWMRGSWS